MSRLATATSVSRRASGAPRRKMDAMAKAEGARFATPQVKAIRVLTQGGGRYWRKR